ncbi:peptide MFS transporter [Dysgonomonas sp. 25]|uniref:peptide MFS transporter n=1 Tax=Dysgonomonas sp. 25 TaxID=2302933 RepID=UPI0013D73FA6|nr:peptide MFS transporter [Dysgonomonas sp. 25]NDV67639.1 MFS transporter [Dysgonomonas sp. 25]
MFKNHPKGLVVLSLANMGERFGYYTMLAIFVLFIQAKFGYNSAETSSIFAVFLAFVYFLPLLGGIVADRFLGYGKTIILGVVIMFGGYLLLAVPTGVNTTGKIMMFGALSLIAIGTGFFKGNLQALLGNMYDDPKYSSKRDLAYSIFYMCINIGAFFAPSAAEAITNYFLGKSGLTYNAAIPSLAHQYADGTITGEGLANFTKYAEQQIAGSSANLTEFGNMYIDKLSESYNYGFAVACFSLVISLLIFIIFRKTYKKADVTARQQKAADEAAGTKTLETLSPAETKERIIALCLVFAVVIFFWMAFHQNGLTLTFFARDYTVDKVSGFDRFSFGLPTMLMVIVGFYGLISMFTSSEKKNKLIGGLVFILAAVGGYFFYNGMPEILSITPQRFQQFNPFFIIILTPLSVGLFSLLSKKGKEPSAPRKIGYGMLIAALGFVVMSVGSVGLPTPNEVEAAGAYNAVTPNLLIGTYFTLTIAELFLSPMGLSFVSKVAPPQYKGMMQGGWLAATAVGNYAVAIIGYLWGGMQLWLLWGILVVLCIIAAGFIFSIMKRLEKVAK